MTQDRGNPPPGFFQGEPQASTARAGGVLLLVMAIGAVVLVLVAAGGGAGAYFYFRAQSEARAERARAMEARQREAARLREEELRLRAEHERAEREISEREARIDDATRLEIQLEIDRVMARSSVERAQGPNATQRDRCLGECGKGFLRCEPTGSGASCHDAYNRCNMGCGR